MQESLKPRPYRLSEVAWDLVPLIGTFAGCAIYFGGMINQWQDYGFAVLWFAMIVPVAGGAWMQFSTTVTLERLTQREWRESLAMTELDARSYLISQLKPRVVVQSLSFVAGTLSVLALLLLPLFDIDIWPPRFSDLLLMFSIYIFSVLSMQICGFCVGVMGLFSRLRHLCRPNRPDAFIVLTSVKWLLVTLATPALAMIAGVFAALTLIRDGPLLGVYFIMSSSALSVLFIAGARQSWRKLLDGYFRFE